MSWALVIEETVDLYHENSFCGLGLIRKDFRIKFTQSKSSKHEDFEAWQTDLRYVQCLYPSKNYNFQ